LCHIKDYKPCDPWEWSTKYNTKKEKKSISKYKPADRTKNQPAGLIGEEEKDA